MIDLGAGDADLAPPAKAVDALEKAARTPAMSRYGFGLGLVAFREAVSRVDAQALRLEIRSAQRDRAAHRLEGGNLASRARVPRGRRHRAHPRARLSTRTRADRCSRSGELHTVRAAPAHELSRRARRRSWRDAAPHSVSYLNYPNNPTAAIAPRDYLERIVKRCREHDILLVYDNAYSELAFDGYVPPSIFEIDGARDVAIEFHSLSKTYNMTGWRCGWAVGSPEIVGRWRR